MLVVGKLRFTVIYMMTQRSVRRSVVL